MSSRPSEGSIPIDIKDKKACRNLPMTYLCSKTNSHKLAKSQLLHGRWYLTYLQFNELLSECLRETEFTESNRLEDLKGKKAKNFRALFVVQYQSLPFNRTKICAAAWKGEDRVLRKV